MWGMDVEVGSRTGGGCAQHDGAENSPDHGETQMHDEL